MKKSLLVMLLAILSFFMFAGISQAGQCIYLGEKSYYDSSSVRYAGDIVSYVDYDNNACEENEFTFATEIDCARRMSRVMLGFAYWSEWESFPPGSFHDVAWQKLCR